ncbi:hypothetical protein O988_01601, partial [Pseudogymnoascus sp. VKM F-3808]
MGGVRLSANGGAIDAKICWRRVDEGDVIEGGKAVGCAGLGGGGVWYCLGNQLSDLPPELGMTLPNELGSLYHLEMLGIEGNPLEVGLKREIMENGTKALVLHLRETAPVKQAADNRYGPWMTTTHLSLSSSQPQPEPQTALSQQRPLFAYSSNNASHHLHSSALPRTTTALNSLGPSTTWRPPPRRSTPWPTEDKARRISE